MNPNDTKIMSSEDLFEARKNGRTEAEQRQMMQDEIDHNLDVYTESVPKMASSDYEPTEADLDELADYLDSVDDSNLWDFLDGIDER